MQTNTTSEFLVAVVSPSTMGKSQGRAKRAATGGSDDVSASSVEPVSASSEPANSTLSFDDHEDIDKSVLHFLAGARSIVSVESVENIRDSSSSPDARIWVHPSRMLEERLAAGGLVAVRRTREYCRPQHGAQCHNDEIDFINMNSSFLFLPLKGLPSSRFQFDCFAIC